MDENGLIVAARSGDKRATGRLISVVENDAAAAVPILQAVYADAESSWITGVTGAPGVGKSTLVDRVVDAWRSAGRRVAVLAVDPTSPFTGGALLGDRVRMRHDPADQGVLVRSMATRGWLGGMAGATERVAVLCAGLGFDDVIIETVGVGQSEVDVAAAAHTTVVVVTPASGDGIQTAKAGVMEIADVFVVNKADRPDAATMVTNLEEMLRLVPDTRWHPPVVPAAAVDGAGVADVLAALADHRAAGQQNRSERRMRDLRNALWHGAAAMVGPLLASAPGRELEAEVVAGTTDPWTAAAALLEQVEAD